MRELVSLTKPLLGVGSLHRLIASSRQELRCKMSGMGAFIVAELVLRSLMVLVTICEMSFWVVGVGASLLARGRVCKRVAEWETLVGSDSNIISNLLVNISSAISLVWKIRLATTGSASILFTMC